MKNILLKRLHDTEMWSNYRPRIPTLIKILALLGVFVAMSSFWPMRHNGLTVLANIMLGLGILLLLPLIPTGFFVRWIGKYRSNLQSEMLAPIAWRGDETVLDIGCGSGMLLNGAALRLSSGKAVGIDIWTPSGGGGNVDMLWKNAREEGVAERIEFKEADARQLPFEDELFDVVLCSGAVHHISHNPADHEQTISEMVRVLKSGGQVVLWDVTEVMNDNAVRMQQAGVKSEVKGAQPFLGFETSLVIGQK